MFLSPIVYLSLIENRSVKGGTVSAAATEPPVDRRARRREEKFARILHEAWALARRDGLAAISLRELADRVDLRQPSLYAYFESKLDLYDAMFAQAYRVIVDRFRAMPAADDPRDQFVEMVRLSVQVASEDIVRHQLLFQRTIPGFEPSDASMAIAYELYDFGSDIMRRAGLSTQEHFDMATAVMAGLAHQQVANDPGGDRWERLAESTVDLLLASVHTKPRRPTKKGSTR